MNICQDLGDQDMFETYNDYVSPALTQCDDICKTFTHKGSMQETIPETAPIEVCYCIGNSYVTYSVAYLIYDLNVIVGTIGGTMGLFLGFSLTGLVNQLCGVIKAHLQ